MGEYDALHILFYLILGFAGVVIVLMLIKLAYRNLPLWLFELWPHLTGLLVGAALLFRIGWIAALIAAAAGLVLGMVWSGFLEQCRRRGREQSRLERIHSDLIKWAQK